MQSMSHIRNYNKLLGIFNTFYCTYSVAPRLSCLINISIFKLISRLKLVKNKKTSHGCGLVFCCFFFDI